jgi:hypothetical protein
MVMLAHVLMVAQTRTDGDAGTYCTCWMTPLASLAVESPWLAADDVDGADGTSYTVGITPLASLKSAAAPRAGKRLR